jgi:hypothetical protein
VLSVAPEYTLRPPRKEVDLTENPLEGLRHTELDLLEKRLAEIRLRLHEVEAAHEAEPSIFSDRYRRLLTELYQLRLTSDNLQLRRAHLRFHLGIGSESFTPEAAPQESAHSTP